MGVRRGILFLLVLGISWICVDSRNLSTLNVPNVKSEKVCTMCEQFATRAISHLRENKTQTEIINTLHQTCSRMLFSKQECLVLVDHYASLIFLEIETIQPRDFCQKIDLCDDELLNGCKVCHRAIEKVMDKLDDPDAQVSLSALSSSFNSSNIFSLFEKSFLHFLSFHV